MFGTRWMFKLQDVLRRDPMTMPRVSLYTAGPPCQAVSSAGRKRGLETQLNSTVLNVVALWNCSCTDGFLLKSGQNKADRRTDCYKAIHHYVQLKKPDVVLLEMVKAVLNKKFRRVIFRKWMNMFLAFFNTVFLSSQWSCVQHQNPDQCHLTQASWGDGWQWTAILLRPCCSAECLLLWASSGKREVVHCCFEAKQTGGSIQVSIPMEEKSEALNGCEQEVSLWEETSKNLSLETNWVLMALELVIKSSLNLSPS